MDIDLANNIIHVTNRKDFKTKSRKSRDIPIPPSLKERIGFYMTTWVDPIGIEIKARTKYQTDYLFCKGDGSKIGSFKRSLDNLYKRAEIKEAGTHTMRHTYASQLAMAGQSIKAIQELLGHSDIKTTQIYAHLIPEYKHQGVQALPYALPTVDYIEIPSKQTNFALN